MRAIAKKTLIGIAGGSVLLAGLVMIFIPGPALLVIPAGLAILATEFQWAQRINQWFKEKYQHARDKYRERHPRRPTEAAPDKSSLPQR